MPSKKSEKSFFMAENIPKINFGGPKVLNQIDREHAVVFMQKWDESDQKVPENLDLTR